jgi:hypothetical protein
VIIHNVKQGTAEWHKLREGVPTASEFHRIITPKGWTYATGAQSYINKLIGEKFSPMYGDEDEFSNNSTRRGNLLEPESRRFYEFKNNVTVEEVGFITTDDGRFGYSPDGLVGERGLIESKSPNPTTHVEYLRAGVVPDKYLGQCYGGLIVTGRDWIDFLSYCPGLPTLEIRVERDEKLDRLWSGLERFWDEYQTALEKVKSMFEPLPTREVETQAGSYTEELYVSPF